VSAALSGSVAGRLKGCLNASVFSQQASFTFGNRGRKLPNVRAPGTVNIDFSMCSRTFTRWNWFRPAQGHAILNAGAKRGIMGMASAWDLVQYSGQNIYERFVFIPGMPGGDFPLSGQSCGIPVISLR
jgi:hypothetical protein